MNGLELSRAYYEAFGKPMLESDFPELLPYLAVGTVGSGSDRFGFDDELSRDHDFEPGFCIFLPGEETIDRRSAFLLERAYAKLPKTFKGFSRQPLSPVGGNRFGVLRTSEFYLRAAGTPDGIMTARQWLALPDYALAEATNGEVFYDGYGEFSRIRSVLSRMPSDVLYKRLAGNLLLMGQAGRYNFGRCLKHGEPEAAQLACVDFVNAALKAAFLLRGKYCPYYKWSFRALRALEGGAALAEKLSLLLRGDNRDNAVVSEKSGAVEAVSREVIALLREKGLTDVPGDDLGRHAYALNDRISDGEIRNLHILSAVGN